METTVFAMTPQLQPQVTGEEMCAALGTVARSVDAVIPNGRGVWTIHLTSEEVATGLEMTGIRIRGMNIEVTQRFPGGTWVRVRGFPINVGNAEVQAIFEKFGEIVSGPHHVMWKGTHIKTGDRTLKIKLERSIPQSFNTMGGKQKITTRYKDQPQTCYECGQPGHEKKDCHEQQTYAKKVLTNPPQPKPEQEKEPETDLNSTPGTSLSEEEMTDVEVRRKERKDKKEKKERKKKEKKNSEPVMNSTADGKRKDAPSPESVFTPTPIGRHRLPQAIPVYKIRKQ